MLRISRNSSILIRVSEREKMKVKRRAEIAGYSDVSAFARSRLLDDDILDREAVDQFKKALRILFIGKNNGVR